MAYGSSPRIPHLVVNRPSLGRAASLSSQSSPHAGAQALKGHSGGTLQLPAPGSPHHDREQKACFPLERPGDPWVDRDAGRGHSPPGRGAVPQLRVGSQLPSSGRGQGSPARHSRRAKRARPVTSGAQGAEPPRNYWPGLPSDPRLRGQDAGPPACAVEAPSPRAVRPAGAWTPRGSCP